MSDAVHDGVLGRSDLAAYRKPRTGKQRPYVATTEQIWKLHDAIEPRYQAGLPLAAFAGLRQAEVCGLRVSDVDFMRGIVHPVQQYPAEPLNRDQPYPYSMRSEPLGPRYEDYRRVSASMICAITTHCS